MSLIGDLYELYRQKNVKKNEKKQYVELLERIKTVYDSFEEPLQSLYAISTSLNSVIICGQTADRDYLKQYSKCYEYYQEEFNNMYLECELKIQSIDIEISNIDAQISSISIF